jgi:alpha-galactosidase/6-phospho-beta-glucosidase family protein
MNDLTNEKLNLIAVLEDTDNKIKAITQELATSLTGDADSDGLSAKLATLKTKRDALVSALDINEQNAIRREQELEQQRKQQELSNRKAELKKALKSLENASKLTSDLMTELKNVRSHNEQANLRTSEIENSIRGLVGRLANEFKLYGGLAHASNIQVVTTADYDRLASHVK